MSYWEDGLETGGPRIKNPCSEIILPGEDMKGNVRYSKLIMPFGKHKGQRLGTVPIDYLRWLERSCKFDQEFIRNVVRVILVKQHQHAKVDFRGYKDIS